jgi:7-keto-8-aminopelargonate synthetase-like enzyme
MSRLARAMTVGSRRDRFGMAGLARSLDLDQGDGSAANYQLDNSIITVQMTRPEGGRTGGVRHMDYKACFADALQRLHDECRYRVFADLERLAGRFPRAIWHSPEGPRDVTVWCSNDYLGMGQHPKVIGAMVETATRVGAGAGGTRNIAGTNHPLVQLERELAELHGKDSALVFTSGYVSNDASISTLAKLIPDCLILSDAWNHNSMITGVRNSGMEKVVFRHNDLEHLEQLLKAGGKERGKLIVFESLYSMDGDVSPISPISLFANSIATAYALLRLLNLEPIVPGAGALLSGAY